MDAEHQHPLRKLFAELKLEETTMIYIPLRAAGFFVTVFWTVYHPNVPAAERLIMQAAIGIFFVYSCAFYIYAIRDLAEFTRRYLYLLLPDLLTVAVLVRYSHGLDSPFLVGFYLIASLHGFYYGFSWAMIAAAVASFLGLAGNIGQLIHPAEFWADEISKFAFLWALAISSGFFGTKIELDKENIGELNEMSNRQLMKLSALYEIEKAISLSVKLDQILAVILSISTKILDADAGSILLSDKDKKHLIFKSVLGAKVSILKEYIIDYGSGIVGRVAESGEPVILDDVSRDPGHIVSIDEMTGYKTHNLICVPLKTPSGTIGAIELLNKRDGKPFDRDDLDFLTSIASTASSAIERAYLFSETEMHVEELDTIMNIVNAIGVRSRLKDIFETVMEQVKKLFPGDYGIIYLIDRDSRSLKPEISFGPAKGNEDMHTVPERLNQCLVIADGNPLFSSQSMDKLHPCAEFLGPKTKSFICIPIKAGMSSFGVLHIGSCKDDDFDAHHVRLAKGIGEQLAIAVQRAYLFDQINEMAVTDELTGLLNFREFQNKLEDEMKRSERYNRPLSLLMMDIDHFKNYNDSYGHPKGDIVLRRIGGVLRDAARDTDLVFRYGGEELSVLLPETDKEQARVIAERMRQFIEDTRFEGEETQPLGRISISIGVASSPYDAITKESLVEKADIALYKAKDDGRNLVRVYDRPRD